MHRLLAARAVRVDRRDRLVNARQMSRQRAAVDPPFPRCIGGDLPLLLDRLGLGDRLFEVFQRRAERGYDSSPVILSRSFACFLSWSAIETIRFVGCQMSAKLAHRIRNLGYHVEISAAA
jgi:hypothetical protein